jgi:hypothetical protein
MKQLSQEHLKAALLFKGTLMLRSILIAIGIAICFVLISCDLFKTRTPEEPSQQSSNYVPPTEPSLVLQNMVSEFQGGDAVHYKNSFSDVFSFTPSTSAQGKYGIDWTAWNSTQEQSYFKNLFVQFNNANIILTFESILPTQINSTTYEVVTAYSLTLPIEAGVIKKFNGQVQFTFVQDPSGSWSINRWVDIGTDSTWSDLKGVAYSRW